MSFVVPPTTDDHPTDGGLSLSVSPTRNSSPIYRASRCGGASVYPARLHDPVEDRPGLVLLLSAGVRYQPAANIAGS